MVKPGPDPTDVDFSLGRGPGFFHHLLPLVSWLFQALPPTSTDLYKQESSLICASFSLPSLYLPNLVQILLSLWKPKTRLEKINRGAQLAFSRTEDLPRRGISIQWGGANKLLICFGCYSRK